MSRTFKDSKGPQARYLWHFISKMGNPNLVSRANFWYKKYQELVREKWVSDWDRDDGIHLSKAQKEKIKRNKHKQEDLDD